jgi:DNA invertase Pin-like site-specific DNA recombinase
MRAAIYVRISQDREGTRAGVERQLADCKQAALARKWQVVEIFEDNDVSAYAKKGKQPPRPAYERMMASINAGQVDSVIAWHTDRLWRDVSDFFMFVSVANLNDVKLITAIQGDYDLKNDETRATFDVVLAKHSSDASRRRIKRAQEQAVAEGRFYGGPRSFGYEIGGKYGLKMVASEARILREAAARLLSGESCRSVARDLNRRGITTVAGKLWTVENLTGTLCSPRVAAINQYSGLAHQGNWKPILTVDQHERLCAMREARKGLGRAHEPRKHLLTGLLRCSRCGCGMGSLKTTEGLLRYSCKTPELGGCSGTTIKGAETDQVVFDLVAEYLDSSDFEKAIRRADKKAAKDDVTVTGAINQLGTDRARIHEIENDYADGLIDRNEFRRMKDRIMERIGANEASIEKVSSAGPAAKMAGNGKQFLAAWPKMDVLEKRQILDALITKIVVAPAVVPKNIYQPARLKVEWRFMDLNTA